MHILDDFQELDSKLHTVFAASGHKPTPEDSLRAVDPLRAPDRLSTYIDKKWVVPGIDQFGQPAPDAWSLTDSGRYVLSEQAGKWSRAKKPATAKA